MLHGKANKPIMICPRRLLERRQVFTDCLHLLTTHEPGNELHVVPEVTVPGGSVDFERGPSEEVRRTAALTLASIRREFGTRG